MKSQKLLIPIAIFSLIIGLYPIIYTFVPKEYTFLSTKSLALLNDKLWVLSFYLHIIFGGLSLFIGWIQFLPKFRANKPLLHRRIGAIYISSVLVSSIAGIYIGFFANEGILSSIGFILLGIVWFLSTIKAFLEIKKGNISSHHKWMIFSYAACFSAVTLRVYLPLLNLVFDSAIAYQLVAWLCWVPNIAAAFLITKKLKL